MKPEATKFAAFLSYGEEQGVWRVRSIDVSHSGILHKLTFPDMPPLSEVFVEAMTLPLAEFLGGMDPEGEMFANSDFELGLKHARFRKLRLHTSHNATRGYEASFWFSSFEGQPLTALKHYAPVTQELPQMDPVNNLAIQAMDRVLIPALNVVSAARNGLRTDQNVQIFDDYASRLIQESDDLIMYAELVKRLILSQDPDSPSEGDNVLEVLAQPHKKLGRTGS